MAKIPDELKVRFTVHDISMEVPKPLFENAAIKVAVFFGRKGKGSLTRRTKWFTVADPSTFASSTRQMVALPPASADKLESSRRSTTKVGGGGDSAENSVRQVPGELAVLNFGSLNDVIYDTELRPLNKFDDTWVFDQKLTHPVTVFAKVFIKMRPNAKGNAAKSEQESNLNEMLQMDQSEMDDDFSGDDDDGARESNERPQINLEGMNLTAEQLALLTDGKTEDEVLIEALKYERDCKKRYLAFPKTIDLGSVANTRAKKLEFSERLNCKSASLLGSVISFKITAEVDESKLAQYEVKKKEKDEKEERKRREKEEKILEKERKKQEKAEAKERKKRGEKDDAYGCDVTRNTEDGAATATEAGKGKAQENTDKQKTSLSPFNKIKSIFASKEKTQTTPFPIKCDSTPYPYLFLLDKFVLHKLTMPPTFYRGVHIRLGCDPAVIDGYPTLLLNTETKSYLKEADITGYDGQRKHIFKFDFGNTHVYFADKHIRNITGFDTIRALTEREQQHQEAKKREVEGGEKDEAQQHQTTNDLFKAEILKVGEKFQPMAFQATKYSASGAQVESTKFTRVTAQLLIPKDIKNLKIVTDEEERDAYFKGLQKEQKKREKEEKKEEKKRRREEKKAAKAKKGEEEDSSSESSEEETDSDDGNDDDIPAPVTEHESPRPVHGASGAAAAQALKPANEGEADMKTEGEGQGEVLESAVETGDESKEAPKDPKASKESRFSLNKTSSFQLGFHLINEENVPAEGVKYSIRFETGEELCFRARRVYLPSVAPLGDSGASKSDTPLLEFTPGA